MIHVPSLHLCSVFLLLLLLLFSLLALLAFVVLCLKNEPLG